MGTLPEPEVGEDPGSWDTHEVWNTREAILHTGMIAAGSLARWEAMLAFSKEVAMSMASRDASPLERAAAVFSSYHALLGLGRLEQARELLRDCRDIFAEHHDSGLIGKAIGALGDIETRMGHHDAALRLHQDALRLQYTAADLPGICTGHVNVARALRRTSGDTSAAIAHDLAAAIIGRKAGLADLELAVTAVAHQIGQLPDLPAVTQSFAALCKAVGALDGVDLAGLLARTSPRITPTRRFPRSSMRCERSPRIQGNRPRIPTAGNLSLRPCSLPSTATTGPAPGWTSACLNEAGSSGGQC